MTSPKRSYTRVNRPAQAGELVGVRLQPEYLARIDAWRTAQPAPLTRPEAMRLLMDLGLAARDRAPTLLDLPDLILIDGLDRPAPRKDLAPASDMPLPPPEEPWPEDLRDSFIMAAESPLMSGSHERAPALKPLPGKPLDRLGPLGPLAPLTSSGRGRNR